MRAVIACAGLACAACGALIELGRSSGPELSSERVGPNLYSITCESRASCYREAGRLCRLGFTVLDAASSTNPTATRVGDQVFVNEHRTGDLLVRCKSNEMPPGAAKYGI